MRVYDDPEFVAGLHDWITDVYIALIRHFARLGDLPITSVHIGECSGTMLRPAHYERFVIPYAGRIGRDEAVRTLKRDTRRFAKRQMTWFRADPQIVWIRLDRMSEISRLARGYLLRPTPDPSEVFSRCQKF